MGEGETVSTFYTLLQLVPNPMADERINLGVIAYNEEKTVCSFIRDFRRVKVLSGYRDTSFFEDLFNSLEKAAESGSLRPQRLEQMVREWSHALQFTPARPSALPPEELAEKAKGLFLFEYQPKKRDVRDRRAAIHLAYRAVKQGLPPDRAKVVKRGQTVPGAITEHHFSLAAVNGRILFAAEGMSFEGREDVELKREVDAVAWKLDDVQKAQSVPHLAVIVLPPKSESAAYEKAVAIYNRLGATVVTEDRIAEWGRQMQTLLVRY